MIYHNHDKSLKLFLYMILYNVIVRKIYYWDLNVVSYLKHLIFKKLKM